MGISTDQLKKADEVFKFGNDIGNFAKNRDTDTSQYVQYQLFTASGLYRMVYLKKGAWLSKIGGVTSTPMR